MKPDMAPIPSDEAPTDHEARTGRVFVIHLRADADPSEGVLRGRAQHMRTGDAAHFDSLDELVSFVAACVGHERG